MTFWLEARARITLEFDTRITVGCEEDSPIQSNLQEKIISAEGGDFWIDFYVDDWMRHYWWIVTMSAMPFIEYLSCLCHLDIHPCLK